MIQFFLNHIPEIVKRNKTINKISLCIIDTSWIKHNKEVNFKKVLKIIEDIIAEHSHYWLCSANQRLA